MEDPKTTEQEARRDQELAKDLKQIYSDTEGQLPDFTRLDGKPGSRFRSALFGAIVGIAVMGAAAWAGIFFFSRTSGFTGDAVELSVATDGDFTAGAEADVIVRYRNGERVPLARADIGLKAPEGFEILGSEPATAEDGSWAVGSIAPGAEGEVRVHGYVRRELDAAMTFEARLDYKPADFNSDFQKTASHTVVVSGSVLTLDGAGPEQMTPGDDIAFVFTYENTSDADLEKVRVVADPPEGFIFGSAEPQTDPDVALQWSFDKIEAHAKGTITVHGTFAATSRGPKALHARMGFADDAGGVIAIATADAKTEVLKSNLDLSLIVNGSEKPAAASFGDTLFFSVRYENGGDVPLKDVAISADLPSEPAGPSIIDWVSLKDDLDGTLTGTTIVWTKKELPSLAALAPGDKGEIGFSVQLIRKPLADAKSSKYVVHAVASAKIGKVGSISGSREVHTAPSDVALLSDAAFKAYGRYFTEDGTPLGSGPLPPQVGQKTTYRMFWTVQNSLHELTNLSVTTVLPQGVKWTGIERPVEAGALTFDETGRKATWRLNRLPTSVPSVTISFDVELTPEFEDIGKILDLTGDNRFEAFDKDVESVILKTEPPIGTDLVGDQSAAGKGVVKE